MDQSRIELGIGTVADQPANGARSAMKVILPAGWFYGALIIVLSVWILHSFLEALLAACVTAIASWPLYRQFAARLPRRMARSAIALIFTSVMTVFVLAPLMFAFGALLTEAHALLLEIAAADKEGIAAPHWLENVPLAGPWLAARWQSELAHPGALSVWTQRTDPAALLGWAQSLGQFMARHAVHHRIHDPGAVLPVSGRRIAGGGFQASASSPHRRARRRLCRSCHAGRARFGEQHAGRRAVRWIRNRDRVRDRRRAARRRVGRDHRLARARPVSRLCRRRRVDVETGDDGRRDAGAYLIRAGLLSSCSVATRSCGP